MAGRAGPLLEYIKRGQRVLSTECILCFACVDTCPKGALDTSFGLDVGGQEWLNVRAGSDT